MSFKKGQEQLLLTMGVTGGFALTALVLIIQAKKMFEIPVEFFASGHEYFIVLIISFGAISSLSLVGSLATVAIAIDPEFDNPRTEEFAERCFVFSAVGLGFALPLLLLPFSPKGAIVLFVFNIALLFVFILYLGDVLRRTNRRNKPMRTSWTRSITPMIMSSGLDILKSPKITIGKSDCARNLAFPTTF